MTKLTATPVTYYRVGTISLAGSPILYDRSYTLEEARETAQRLGGGARVFKVNVEEVA
jgi:hypothetical protein